jgi:hypothetical protein
MCLGLKFFRRGIIFSLLLNWIRVYVQAELFARYLLLEGWGQLKNLRLLLFDLVQLLVDGAYITS